MSQLQKRRAFRSREMLDAAKGQPCTVNSPYCTYDSDTTVAAHFNESYAGKGGGLKADDCAHVQACNGCHDFLDGRIRGTDQAIADREWYWRRAHYRTIRNLLDRGILVIS